MPYAQETDLMLGDITLGPAVDPLKYLQEAEEDVNIALGQRYEMPYDTSQPDAPETTVILLRRITARLASGRLILAQAIGGEDESLQAYGKHLIDEANAVIKAIVEGRLDFEGPVVIEGADELRGPYVDNYDKTSAVDAFYTEFMTPNAPSPARLGPVWQPGG